MRENEKVSVGDDALDAVVLLDGEAAELLHLLVAVHILDLHSSPHLSAIPTPRRSTKADYKQNNQ